TITVWINKLKPIAVDNDKTITTEDYRKMLKKIAVLAFIRKRQTLPTFLNTYIHEKLETKAPTFH
ncbi:hypothetical protein, partial [Clostridium sp.]|uniref:hypothetical protein n=1 Tax=Clostridium sp. TaxID=1506 RepID=UPI003EEA1BE4